MLSRRRMILATGLGLGAHLGRLGIARARPADPDAPELPSRPPEPEPQPEPEPEPPPPPVALLTGVPLGEEDAGRNDLLPVAVSFDNFAWGARPQMGLDRADLVYELLVEGGITRFLGVFHRREAEWLEPVRSARMPMLFVAKELGAVLGHVGAASVAGPADADTAFGKMGVLHFDGDLSPGPFWRDRRRFAPHNACTSTVELRGHAMGLSWFGPSDMAMWQFKDDLAEDGESRAPASRLGYGFALQFAAQGLFTAAWSYDAGENRYYRSMAGTAHLDGLSGAQLSAKNVVVQLLGAWVGSREGHILYNQVGEGMAYVFRDGHVVEAVWSKRWAEDRTRFWHPSGEELSFNRGETWIALVPYGSPFWYS